MEEYGRITLVIVITISSLLSLIILDPVHGDEGEPLLMDPEIPLDELSDIVESDAPNTLEWSMDFIGQVDQYVVSTNDRIYLVDELDNFYCINKNGDMIWMLEDHDIPLHWVAFDEQDDLFYFNGYDIVMIDPYGNEKWNVEMDLGLNYLMVHESGILFAFSTYGGIAAFDINDGSEMWNLTFDNNFSPLPDHSDVRFDGSPVLLDNGIIFQIGDQSYMNESITRHFRYDLSGNEIWNVSSFPMDIYDTDIVLSNGTLLFTSYDVRNDTNYFEYLNIENGSKMGSMENNSTYLGDHVLTPEGKIAHFSRYSGKVHIEDKDSISTIEPTDPGSYFMDSDDGYNWFLFIIWDDEEESVYLELKDLSNDTIWGYHVDELVLEYAIVVNSGEVFFIGKVDELNRVDLDGNHEMIEISGGIDVNSHFRYTILSEYRGGLLANTIGMEFLSLDMEGIWKFDVKGRPLSNPVVDPFDNIIISDISGLLYSIDRNGSTNWILDTGDPICSEVVISGELIYGVSFNGKMFCCDLEGNMVWDLSIDDTFVDAPIVSVDGRMMACSEYSDLYFISKDGVLLWSYVEEEGWSNFGCLYSDDGSLFVCVNWSLIHFSYIGDIKWRNDSIRAGPSMLMNDNGTFYVSGNYLYLFNENGMVLSRTRYMGGGDFLLRTEDGRIIQASRGYSVLEVLHQETMESDWYDIFQSPSKMVLVDDNKLLINGDDIILVNEVGEIDWMISVPDSELRDYRWTSPTPGILSDGSLVISGDELYFISNNGTGEKLGPPDIIGLDRYESRLTLKWDYHSETGFYLMEGLEIWKANDSSPPVMIHGSESIEEYFQYRPIEWDINQTYVVIPVGRDGVKGEPDQLMTWYIPYYSEPSRPEDFKTQKGEGKVTITWSLPEDDGDLPILRYNIYRSMNGENYTFFDSVSGSNLSYVDRNVTPGIRHYYKVTAENQEGESRRTSWWSSVPKQPPADPMDDLRETGVLCGMPLLILLLGFFLGHLFLKKQNDGPEWFDGGV